MQPLQQEPLLWLSGFDLFYAVQLKSGRLGVGQRGLQAHQERSCVLELVNVNRAQSLEGHVIHWLLSGRVAVDLV